MFLSKFVVLLCFSALKELFRAKGGGQFPSEFLTGEVESLQTNDEQIKQEGEMIQSEEEKMEDANDTSVSCSSSLIGLNDASDEFYDVPEPSDEKRDTNTEEDEEQSLLVYHLTVSRKKLKHFFISLSNFLYGIFCSQNCQQRLAL